MPNQRDVMHVEIASIAFTIQIPHAHRVVCSILSACFCRPYFHHEPRRACCPVSLEVWLLHSGACVGRAKNTSTAFINHAHRVAVARRAQSRPLPRLCFLLRLCLCFLCFFSFSRCFSRSISWCFFLLCPRWWCSPPPCSACTAAARARPAASDARRAPL